MNVSGSASAPHDSPKTGAMAAITAAASRFPVNEDRLAALAKALGHPARVRILRLLGARDSCVTGQLAPELGLAASTVSEHLRILREAGLIETESAEGRPCYCLSEDGLWSLIAGVHGLLRGEPVREGGSLVGPAPAAGR